MKILLFGTMGDIGPAVRDSLLDCGYDVALVDFPQNICRDAAGYRRELLKAAELYHPEAILPIGDSLNASRLKSEIPQIIVGNEDKISLLSSKVRLYEFAQKLGITLPERYLNPDDCPADKRVVFKRDISFGGHGVHIPLSKSALLNLIAHQSPGEPYLIEDYIEGDEISVDVIRCAGEVLISSYRCLRESVSSTAPASRREITVCPEAERQAAFILDALDYTGVCGFDFIVSGESAYLLEANPRFTGGVAAQIEAGFNIPVELLTRVSGRH